MTINGWILMQRMVAGGSVSFDQNWAEYRDGFGSAAGNDNYWLGLNKVYRLVQLYSVTLRVEVCKLTPPLCYLVRLFCTFQEIYSVCLLKVLYCFINVRMT